MKNLTKIFMAVAALFVAFACTTDVTDDLDVQYAGTVEGQTVISLSLEESRTQLGEKAGELYPLYWSEGDKISVNGAESGEAQISAENGAVASFAVSASAPYCIAYPAAPSGQVVFADKQNHVVSGDTFESGVSTMYAYSESGLGVQLNHLTGVLKIGILGSATLDKVQVSTVDRAPIAGNFDFDFAEGKLTPSTLSKDVIEYSFGEGVQLSSEPTYIHVAVPAGVYDELYLTLYEKGNSGNIMYTTVKAGTGKPLTAGMIREFKIPITYEANAKLFVINSVEKLQAFKTAIESEEGLAADAIFTEDIDMAGVEWTPINGTNYANAIIGNGYAIKNLTAPLFDTTSASIKGLHLEDVNIVSNGRAIVGALACTITATETALPVVEHCSVSGNITVNNESTTYTEDTPIGAAGLVADSYGVQYDGCVNHANITFSKAASAETTATITLYGGGITYIMRSFTKSDSTIVATTIQNSKNYGEINDESAATTGYLYLGGIAGASASTNPYFIISSCENRGNISTNSKTSKNRYIGGIAGYARGNTDTEDEKPVGLAENNVNWGKITIKSGATHSDDLDMGGLFGAFYASTINNSTNHGDMEIESGALAYGMNLGGVIGVHTSELSGYYIRSCVNNGDIIYNGSPKTATTKNVFKIGGIVGYSQGTLYSNINNGDIVIAGTFNSSGARPTSSNEYKNGTNVIAGIVGYKTVGKVYGCENHGDIIISGTLKELSTKTVSQIKIGGITSYISSGVDNANASYSSVSDGKIEFSGTSDCELVIGGAVAHSYGTQSTLTSNAKIEISGTANQGVIIGGAYGWTFYSVNSLTFGGTIDIKESAVIKKHCLVGGCIGGLTGVSTTVRKVSNLTNNGTLTLNGSFECVLNASGCVGRAEIIESKAAHTFTNLVNNGSITCNGPISGGSESVTYITGCIGRVAGNVTDAANHGAITFNSVATEASNSYIAGTTGHATTAVLSNLTNDAAITIGADAQFVEARIGGCSAYLNSTATLSGSTNTGNITVNTTTASGSVCVGGVASVANGGPITDCTNKGDLTVTDTSHKTYVSGIVYESGGDISNCTNLGKLSVLSSTYSCTINGIVHNGDGNISNCVNGEKGTDKGSISFSGNTRSGRLYLSGIGSTPDKNITDATNYAPITFTGSTMSTLHIGGISATSIQAGYTWTDCRNYGDITLSGYAGDPSIEGSEKGADTFVGGLVDLLDTSETKVISLIRGENHGKIEFTSDFKCANAVRTAGIVARQENNTMFYVEDCWNSGDVIYSGTVSARSNGVYRMAGCFGAVTAGSHTTKGYIINSGNVSYNGTNTSSVYVGGVYGNRSIEMTLAEGETEGRVINTGNISCSGTAGSDIRVGGLAGITSAIYAPGYNIVNTGDISFSGSSSGEDATIYVGGVSGNASVPIENAYSYCNINSTGDTGSGWIMGTARTPNISTEGDVTTITGSVAKNCFIGGEVTTFDPSDFTTKKIPLTSETFFNYIYGSREGTDWTGTDNYDGCQVLTEKPVVTLPTKL